MKKTTTIFAALAMFAVSGSANAQSVSGVFIDRDGNNAGTVQIRATSSGYLLVMAGVNNLRQGPHGFHIHETGKCEPENGFKSAGGHYAGDASHGVNSADGPHPGDFPNVTAGPNGQLVAEFFTDRLSISGETNPILDEDGSALIIHSGADDYVSQPSGDAGDRVACAVLERSQ